MAVAFGKYQLQRKLAEGGMAEVFLARQGGMEGFEKLVVLKRILPVLSKEENFVKMFLNEARVAARLNHPNIVQIWDLGKIDELYFIAMEFVHGEDLRSLVQMSDENGTRPSAGLICRILADTLAGLHYAHTRCTPDGKPLGLVHRDVSPQNVLVTFEGGLKLVDFGIAKATRATSEQTQAGLFKGKFAYMSPEQSRGQPVDARSDVFSVGILMWELLTWHRLFKRPSEMATLIAVSEDPIPSPRSVDPSISPELERIVMKALTRPLDQRYLTAQDMRADLEALVRDQRWEGDALALQQYMRELFSAKLRAQDEDVKASGLASLEDFLLTIEERTSISWMEQQASSPHKTPSIGLKPAQVPSDYNDGETIKGDDFFAGKLKDPVELPLASGPTLIADPSKSTGLPRPTTSLRPSPSPAASPAPARPAAPAPSRPQPSARQAAAAGAFTASPTSPTAQASLPGADGLFPSDRSTARRPSFDPPSRWRRLIVAGSAAIVVAGVGLTLALWPETPPPIALPQPEPSSTQATLVITTDLPAVITVDGATQPLGQSATVAVTPGVEHVVTVQRPGQKLKTVHVPLLAAGERLPLTVSVR